MIKKVAIIDYGMSNLFSVYQACIGVGLTPIITWEKEIILKADAAILPGVGAFGDAMIHLNESGLSKTIKDFIDLNKPFLGICLGMQLLFTETEEFGVHKGLDIIKGQVKKFPNSTSVATKIKVPQIGWNQIRPISRETENGWKNSILQDTKIGEFMYFVHSYYTVPSNSDVILCQTDYEGISYCSGLRKDNVYAFQFHPEKSGLKGIEIYAKWASTILP